MSRKNIWLTALLIAIGGLVLTNSANAQSITHSATQNILVGNTISCNANNLHADSSYWRSFNLCTPFNLSSEIEITAIEIGIEASTPAAGIATQPIILRLYDDPNGGSPSPVSSLTLLYEENYQVPVIAGGAVFNAALAVPQSISCHSTLVVEVNTPDGQVIGHSFFMGSNQDGQSSPSFISAANCGILEPTDLGTIGFPAIHFVMNVVYNVGAPCSPCSGVPVDCHDPVYGSFSIRGIDSDKYSSAPASLISDALVSTTDTIDVAGQVNPIQDLDVRFNATHPYVGDLVITLQSPTGTSVTLHNNLGVNLQNFDCIYDDAGRTNARPFDDQSRIQPGGPGLLADFNGENADGTWTITVVDGQIDPGTGTLNEWELQFTQPRDIPDNDPFGTALVLSVPQSQVDDIQDIDVQVEILHPAVEELSIELLSPAGTSIGLLAAGDASGTNLSARFDDDSALQGYCDGFGSQLVSNGTLSSFDGEEVTGDWTLTLIDNTAGNAGSLSNFDLMINPVPCDPVDNLTCVSDCVTEQITLTWANPATYDSIEIYRNGMLLTTLAGTDVSYTDSTAGAGQHDYMVLSDCNPGRNTASCSVNLTVYNGESDVIFALEGIDLIDSASALEASLIAAGANVLVSNTLDLPCLDPLMTERVWVICGTWPQSYVLSAADGDALVQWHTQGVNMYLEGGDIWGFDPQTALEGYDGIENTINGNILDGDDTLLLLDGADSGLGVDFSGMSEAYAQASAGNDTTDQLAACDVIPDLGGPDAGVIWQGPGYSVGIYYASSFGNVISQSWEFGGFGGDQDALALEYFTQLGGNSVPLEQFKRGDANVDGSINLVDAAFFLNYLFVPNAQVPSCQDSADANDDGSLNLVDVIRLLNYLFVPNSAEPNAPGPNACGADVNADAFPACVYPMGSC